MRDGVRRKPTLAGLGCYASFCASVAQRQLRMWLAVVPPDAVVLDLTPGMPSDALHPRVVGLAMEPGVGARRIRADEELLDCIRPASIGAIVADQGSLAHCAVTEETLRRAFAALRPGGRMLLCVESLRRGLAELAAAGRWAELADAPHADVVLLPTPSGSLRRCFQPEELKAALTDAGFTVDWVRPRTVLPPEAVERAAGSDPSALAAMVTTELKLSAEWTGEIAGSWLLASAVRPG